ncbi:MAG: M56 family metallopeptidase, partial [Syntrophomonadaceae bacterium]
MSNYFITVLNMSLTASYVVLAVIIVRLLLKRAPKIFSYALWAVVLFRLL